MISFLRISALLGLLVLNAPLAHAWYVPGHREITTIAVAHGAGPLRGYFTYNAGDRLLPAYASVEPPGSHCLFADLYAGFQPGAVGSFPRSLDALLADPGWSAPRSTGYSPWTIETYMTTLTSQMRIARTETDWENMLRTAGALAHYIEDMHNPMHMTSNYDGQKTGQYGMHARYESGMIDAEHARLALAVAGGPSALHYIPDIVDTMLRETETNYHHNADILAADLYAYGVAGNRSSPAYYAALWDGGPGVTGCGTFTPRLWQEAALMVADAWYTCWVDAGRPSPVPEPASLGLLLLGALMLLRRRQAGTRS